MDSEPPPRLLFLSANAGEPSEVWMYRQAKGLQPFETHWVALSHKNQADFPEEGFTYRPLLKQRVRSSLAKRLLYNYRTIVGQFAGGNDERESLLKTIADIRPSVALIQFGTTGSYYAPLLAEAGIPIVVHFHGVDASSLMRRFRYRWRMKHLAKLTAAVACVAKYQVQCLKEVGFNADRLYEIPCGVPIQDYAGDRKLPGSHCRFLMVGRLTKKKCPELTIRAFALASQELPEASLVVVGDGDLLDQCHALCEELEVKDAVQFIGRLSALGVRQQMQEADVFIQHSAESELGDKEGWPVAIAEAAASGLPIVSTRHASIPEQVLEGVTGLLVAERDVEGMAAAMVELGKDGAQRQAFSEAARKHIAQFDSVIQIGKLSKVLQSVALATSGNRQ